MPAWARVVRDVVSQHVEEAASLADRRRLQVRGANVRLKHLARADERLAAHLDGVLVAGAEGARLAAAELSRPTHGSCFVAMVCAIQRSDARAIDRLARAAAVEEAFASGLGSALQWSDDAAARPVVTQLMGLPGSHATALALDVATSHEITVPLDSIRQAIRHGSPEAASAAMRLCGRQRIVSLADVMAQSMMTSRDEEVRYAAAHALFLIGDRIDATEILRSLALTPGACQASALSECMRLYSFDQATDLLAEARRLGGDTREVIVAAGALGDPAAVPWLIASMSTPSLARVAGEAFDNITGADIAFLDLDRATEGFANIALEETEGRSGAEALEPRPDALKVENWWHARSEQFARGRRYFVGAELSEAQLQWVLRTGWQRQRAAAAEYLFLWTSSPLFDVDAPGDRQRCRLGMDHDDLADFPRSPPAG